jgi:hypothetical protein
MEPMDFINEVLAKPPSKVQGLNFTEAAEPPPLFNRKLPYYENKQERPAHRVMLELAARGYNVKEVAEMTGYSEVCVNNILRQPPLQKTLVEEIRKHVSVDEEVVKIIKDNVKVAVQTLAGIMTSDEPNVRTADKIAAAQELLSRRYGKCNQPINRGTDVDLNKLSDQDLAQMMAGAN